ncbi:serine/threonine-protein kinase pim-1-like [Acridotheres tristis]
MAEQSFQRPSLSEPDHPRLGTPAGAGSQAGPEAKLTFAGALLSRGISNFSAWHHHLWQLVSARSSGKELELVQNAVFTDPMDQSICVLGHAPGPPPAPGGAAPAPATPAPGVPLRSRLRPPLGVLAVAQWAGITSGRRRGSRTAPRLQVAIKTVPRSRVRHWDELPDGTSAPLEIVLLHKVSTGFPGVIRLLEWLELPNSIVMVLEHPERCQDLQHFIRARGFVPEEVVWELFCQVLEAVRHCTSCGVLHRDVKPENILVDLVATGQAKLIDFGCGTYLQVTAYTHFAGRARASAALFQYQWLLFQPHVSTQVPGAGTQSYSPQEWTKFGWCYGKPAAI